MPLTDEQLEGYKQLANTEPEQVADTKRVELEEAVLDLVAEVRRLGNKAHLLEAELAGRNGQIAGMVSGIERVASCSGEGLD